MTELNDLKDFIKSQFDAMKESLGAHEASINKVTEKQEQMIGEVNQMKDDVKTVKSTAKNNQQDMADMKDEISKLKMGQQDSKRRGSRRYKVFRIFSNINI